MEKKAKESIQKLLNAKNVEEAYLYAFVDSDEQLQDLLNRYADKHFTIKINYVGQLDGIDFFKYQLIGTLDSSITESGVICGGEVDDHYQFCLSTYFLEYIYDEHYCFTCKGSGQIFRGGTVCSICSGVGQQYIPNAYYDTTLHQWMGQYQACSGCGGAGYSVTNIILALPATESAFCWIDL